MYWLPRDPRTIRRLKTQRRKQDDEIRSLTQSRDEKTNALTCEYEAALAALTRKYESDRSAMEVEYGETISKRNLDLAETNHHLNRYYPIFKPPTELLIEILTLTCESEADGLKYYAHLTTLMLVCRAWRMTILQEARLWRVLYLDGKYPDRMRAIAELCLQRSLDVPLHIVIYPYGSPQWDHESYPRVCQYLGELLSHAQGLRRVERITAHVSNGSAADLSDAIRNLANALTQKYGACTLKYVDFTHGFAHGDCLPNVGENFPCPIGLTMRTRNGAGLAWNHPIFRANIHYLVLYNDGYHSYNRPLVDGLLAALANMPALQHLSLDGVLYDWSDEEWVSSGAKEGGVVLESLRFLRISGGLRPCTRLLQYMVLPSITTIIVYTGDYHASEPLLLSFNASLASTLRNAREPMIVDAICFDETDMTRKSSQSYSFSAFNMETSAALSDLSRPYHDPNSPRLHLTMAGQWSFFQSIVEDVLRLPLLQNIRTAHIYTTLGVGMLQKVFQDLHDIEVLYASEYMLEVLSDISQGKSIYWEWNEDEDQDNHDSENQNVNSEIEGENYGEYGGNETFPDVIRDEGESQLQWLEDGKDDRDEPLSGILPSENRQLSLADEDEDEGRYDIDEDEDEDGDKLEHVGGDQRDNFTFNTSQENQQTFEGNEDVYSEILDLDEGLQVQNRNGESNEHPDEERMGQDSENLGVLSQEEIEELRRMKREWECTHRALRDMLFSGPLSNIKELVIDLNFKSWVRAPEILTNGSWKGFTDYLTTQVASGSWARLGKLTLRVPLKVWGHRRGLIRQVVRDFETIYGQTGKYTDRHVVVGADGGRDWDDCMDELMNTMKVTFDFSTPWSATDVLHLGECLGYDLD
ncbi:hypothetical protein K474DRAFT_1404916 [Panus rudis PR-1116 ss-1]|nr:hypothetical protein K474DRAFT_1404916 [Panus rudis PR-1116 ss-1]